MIACILILNWIYELLYALEMRVHGIHIMYNVKCPCRGLHTLGMS